MKVMFLHLENLVISHYRMIQFADEMSNIKDITASYPEFKNDVYNTQLREFEVDVQKYLPFLNKAFEQSDIVVVQTAHTLEFLSALQALSEYHKTPLVMEIDDNPFDIDENHYGFKDIGMGTDIERNTYDQLKFSDAVVASTRYLGDVLSDFNKSVYIVPNSIDFCKWDALEKPQSDMGFTVIGWAGAAGHKKDLSIIKDVFLEILDNNPNVFVKCLHGAKGIIEHPRFLNNDSWTDIDKYPQVLANMGFDIGVAPLFDSEFNRCKSNLRYLELSALKIPTVASDVEPYANCITDGIDGYLADNPKIFLDKITKLIYNKDLRTKIGYSAYQNVKKNYNLKLVTQQYADILKEIKQQYEVQNVDIPSINK